MKKEADFPKCPVLKEVEELDTSPTTNRQAEPVVSQQSELEAQNESLRQSQAALEMASHRYETLFRQTPAALLAMRPNSQVLHASQKLGDLLGFSLAQLRFRPFLRCICMEDRLGFVSHTQEVLSSRQTRACQIQLMDAQKNILPVQLESCVYTGFDEFGSAILTSVMDIAPFFNQINQLESLVERYQSLNMQAPHGALLIDQQGIIQETNFMARQMLGRYEIEGTPFHKLWLNPQIGTRNSNIADDSLPTPEEWKSFFFRSNQWEGYLHPAFQGHGELLYYVRLKNAFSSHQTFIGVQCVLQDVSKLYHEHAKKGEFTSIISHELRTPLTGVIGSLKLLHAGTIASLPASVNKMLDIALRNSDRLLYLINDLLDVGKIESTGLELRLQTTQISPLIRNAIENILESAKHYEVTWSFEDTLPDAFVTVDPQRFQQILTNLLTNASKFSSAGQNVKVTTESKGEQILIKVIDEGLGVPFSFRPYLFKKFSQYDMRISRTKGGTGLGLYISSRLAKEMNGSLHYEENPGGGSIFVISFPETFPDN